MSVIHSRLLEFNLSELAEKATFEFDGIIGMPMLHNLVIEFDFEEPRIKLTKSPKKLDEHTLFSDIEDLPFRSCSIPLALGRCHRPYVKNVEIGTTKKRFLLDTGMNSGLALEEEIFEGLRVTGQISQVRPVAESIIVFHEKRGPKPRMGILTRLKIGPFELNDVPVTASDHNTIGLNLLQQFHMAIDFPRSTLTLIPNKHFGTRIETPESYRLAERPNKTAATR